jgi:hypothetical protein
VYQIIFDKLWHECAPCHANPPSAPSTRVGRRRPSHRPYVNIARLSHQHEQPFAIHIVHVGRLRVALCRSFANVLLGSIRKLCISTFDLAHLDEYLRYTVIIFALLRSKSLFHLARPDSIRALLNATRPASSPSRYCRLLAT